MILWQVQISSFFLIIFLTHSYFFPEIRISSSESTLNKTFIIIKILFFIYPNLFSVGKNFRSHELTIGRFTCKVTSGGKWLWIAVCKPEDGTPFLEGLHRPKTDCTCKGGQQRSYDQKGRNDWQHRASSKELME